MALIWRKVVSDVSYEVRTAGNTIRLYTGGVFHSQYNPNQPLTGHVWDLLMLPALFEPEKIQNVLVLGVGGGTVLKLLQHFIAPQKITGIELNPIHINIAKRFFKLQHKSIELIEADAISWVKQYKGQSFDLIIDDIFSEKDGEPVPVIQANRQWFTYLLKHLSRNGVIVRNFVDKKDLLLSAGLTNAAITKRFSSVFQLSNDLNENYVGVYARSKVNSQQLRKNLINKAGINLALKSCRLKYRIRKLA